MKYLVLASLYIAQGVPYGFFTQALPVLMREQGMSLKAISATSLLFLPWALKFLWAPFVDHVGTRRAWIIPLQLAASGGALGLAYTDLAGNFNLIYFALFFFNVLASVQDVATDGMAVQLLDSRERGLGNGIQTGAYRLGMIFGGGWLLWLFAQQGWQVMFFGMAGLLAATCVPVLLYRESSRPARLTRPAALGFEWVKRLELRGFGVFIALICFYKFGDSLAATMVGPMMRDHGMGKEMIAVWKGTFGSASALAGAALGGWLVFRRGRRWALLVCGLLQTASIFLYLLGVHHVGGIAMLQAGSIAEHLFGGMATVALFSLMMDAADPEHASTDYTLLACAIVITAGVANFAAGVVGDAFGYRPLYVVAFLLSGAGCLVLVRSLDRGAGPDRIRAVWEPRD